MEEKIVINGGIPLRGSVAISGFKNAALPILVATILTADVCVLENIPAIRDVEKTFEILTAMGGRVKMLGRTTVEIDTRNIECGSSPLELVSKLRGSTYLIGAELGRFGRAHVGWPGGCDIGNRPIDQHIKAFEALGATVTTDGGYIDVIAENGTKGNSIYFDSTSVGATANSILAAVLAEGTTVIENPAKEPHIVDLANFLNTCGASITGAGTDVIKIKGVSKLHGCTYSIIPDMIEAGTFMIAAVATGGRVRVDGVIPKHMDCLSAKLEEMGAIVEEIDDSLIVSCPNRPERTNVKTLPYPGFPTDLQPQMATLLCLANGVSHVTETVFENRFKYVDELQKMGAKVRVDGKTAIIEGVDGLTGAWLKAIDLRAGAAMVIAGLAASGTTCVYNIGSIERGYDNIVEKLRSLGADIKKAYIAPAEEAAIS
ncbi:MAG: UDP-N-acetylglucosamine 1-carboxyvinyltransferase [Clostridia bacterium]|nr:UDP-N-acetylglucosamine 1-carboxyvinyltransferase [Clostridia bacterium]